MRILTIASEVPPVRSGVARSVDRVVCGLREHGHVVTVMSYADARVLQGDRVRISDLGVRLALRRRFIRTFDVVHLHGPAPTVSDVLLVRWRLASPQVPLVYTHHFDLAFDHGITAVPCRFYARMTRWLARGCEVVVTTTPSYAERMAGVATQVIPWGVEPREGRVREPSAGPLRIVLVGQMRKYKGHSIAIDAVRGAPELELTIAGDGPLRAEITAAATAVSNVRVVASPGDDVLRRLYDASDVVLLPSTNVSEAFGITLLEGMSSGCVPVASALPGVRDVAGPVGVVFPPGDAAALTDALRELHGDREDLRRRSARALAFAADHTWERTVAGYVSVMEDVLGARQL